MSTVLDIAKVTSKGQITIPADVRRAIGVDAGDKILFVLTDDGQVELRNSNLEALTQAQIDFAGAAEEANMCSEQDLVDAIKQVRAERAKSSDA